MKTTFKGFQSDSTMHCTNNIISLWTIYIYISAPTHRTEDMQEESVSHYIVHSSKLKNIMFFFLYKPQHHKQRSITKIKKRILWCALYSSKKKKGKKKKRLMSENKLIRLYKIIAFTYTLLTMTRRHPPFTAHKTHFHKPWGRGGRLPLLLSGSLRRN